MSAGSDTPTKIDGISGEVRIISIDRKDNIYFGTLDRPEIIVFVLKQGKTTPIPIDGISGLILLFDSKDNIYSATTTDVFKLIPIEKPVPSSTSNKLSSIEIAGIAIGSVAGVAFVVLGGCYLYQYLK